MEYGILVLLHVCGSFVWGGGLIIAGFFFIPSILEAGPGGGAVMGGVMKRKYSVILSIASFVTILTGLRLYSLRFSAEWVTKPEGIALTLGGLLGLSVFAIGFIRQKPLAEKMARLAKEGRGAEIPPVAAQLAKYARIAAWHAVAVIVLMAGHSLASQL